MKVRENVIFENPPPIKHEHKAPHFRAHLESGSLRIDFVDHFADELSAKRAVQPFLDAWEIDAALAYHRREFRFQFEHAEVIDRNPIGNLAGIASGHGRASATFGGATVTVGRPEYPRPPKAFVVTETVRQLWDRYEAAVDDREPATSVGYYCYTAITARASALPKAKRVAAVAADLCVDAAVFTKLRDLTNKGDPKIARKHSPKPVPLTNAELHWIRMAVRVLTQRLGERECDRGAALQQIIMADLPPL